MHQFILYSETRVKRKNIKLINKLASSIEKCSYNEHSSFKMGTTNMKICVTMANIWMMRQKYDFAVEEVGFFLTTAIKGS